MAFKKAKKVPTRLKALVYGEAGTGKTTTALHFPNPAVIDGEKGTEHYGASFDFQVETTSSVNQLMDNINELLEDPGDIKTLVVDPITVFMDNLVIEYTKKLRSKKGNPEYDIQPSDYGPLKQMRKEIIDSLLSLDMNIVCTARVKNKYRQEGKNFMIPDGCEPEVPKEIPYMFDTILRIEIADDGKTRIAYCEKDRTNTLPKMFEFTYDAMVEYLGMEVLNREVNQELVKRAIDESKGRVHEITYEGQTVLTAGIKALTIDAILVASDEADQTQEDLKEQLETYYGVKSLFDLKDDEGQHLVKTLENL